MAELLIDEIHAQGIVRQFLTVRTPFRTPGIHTSDIIADLIRTVPSLAKTIDADEEEVEGMWAAGLMWESAVVQAIGWGPMSFEVEGIIGSPDIVNPVEQWIGECKFTWKKYGRDIRDDWRWMTQVKTYCYMTGLRHVRFYTYHCNGVYPAGAPSPIAVCYMLEFTDQEVYDNWLMMKTHANYMREQREIENGLIELMAASVAS